MRKIERLVLTNQLAMIRASIGDVHRLEYLRQAFEATQKALKVKPRKRQAPPRNAGAFSGDVGDQGYEKIKR